MIKNKKGNVDLIQIVVGGFIAAVIIFIAFMIWTNYSTAVEDMPGFDTPTHDEINKYTDITLAAYDYIFIFIIVALTVLTIVLSFQIDTHPAFFFGSFLLLIVAIVLAVIFSNAFGEIAGAAAFNETTNTSASYPIISNFMANFPFYLLIIGIFVIIILYAKNKGSEY